jgi:hypothetical protein
VGAMWVLYGCPARRHARNGKRYLANANGVASLSRAESNVGTSSTIPEDEEQVCVVADGYCPRDPEAATGMLA